MQVCLSNAAVANGLLLVTVAFVVRYAPPNRPFEYDAVRGEHERVGSLALFKGTAVSALIHHSLLHRIIKQLLLFCRLHRA